MFLSVRVAGSSTRKRPTTCRGPRAKSLSMAVCADDLSRKRCCQRVKFREPVHTISTSQQLTHCHPERSHSRIVAKSKGPVTSHRIRPDVSFLLTACGNDAHPNGRSSVQHDITETCVFRRSKDTKSAPLDVLCPKRCCSCVKSCEHGNCHPERSHSCIVAKSKGPVVIVRLCVTGCFGCGSERLNLRSA